MVELLANLHITQHNIIEYIVPCAYDNQVAIIMVKILKLSTSAWNLLINNFIYFVNLNSIVKCLLTSLFRINMLTLEQNSSI